MDELVLKVRADAKGVRPEIKGIADETDNFKVSTLKASTAVRGFVGDLAQAKSGADVASAALGAFGKILGTSIAGTAIVIAGKVLIDSFNKVSEAVKASKDAVASANAEIAKLGTAKGFEEANAQANSLYRAAEAVDREIKKIEASKLADLIAGIRGAKDEMQGLYAQTIKQADALTRQGIIAGSIELERARGLSENDKVLIQIAEKYNKLIDAAYKINDLGLANTLILKQQAEISDKNAQQKLEAENEYQKQLYKAEEEARIFQRKNAEELAKDKQKLLDSNIEYERKLDQNAYEERVKSERNLRDTRIALYAEYVNAAAENEKKLQETRKKLAKQNLELAGPTLQAAFGRTDSKGAASFLAGSSPQRIEALRQQADRATARAEIERVRQQMAEGRVRAIENAPSRLEGMLMPRPEDVTTQDAINELRRRQKEEARQGGAFTEQIRARDEMMATETTLQNVRDLLKENIDTLTNFSTAS